MPRLFTIFASDFKPMRGGVAEYTYQMANGLSNIGRLDQVITTTPQHSASDYAFEVTGPTESYGRKMGDRWGDAVPLTRKINTLVYLAKNRLTRYRAIKQLLQVDKNTHFLFTWADAEVEKSAIEACIGSEIGFSVVFHGLDLILLAEHDPAFLNTVCKQAALCIFNSEATRDLCRTLSPTAPTRSYILHPGINPAQIDAAGRVPVGELEHRFDITLEGNTVFLSLARLVERKGIDIALRALVPVLQSSDEMRYIIAGDGPEYDRLGAAIAAHNVQDKVALIGEVSDAEKYGLLEASSVFLMPNHTRGGKDFEGFGICFIEASYFENVVIGGRSGGAVEAIAEDKSGFLFDFEDSDAEQKLRTRLVQLVENPERMADLARQGREYVLNHYQAPKLVAQFAEAFDELAQEATSSSARYE